jgi:hypothetical protein
LVLWSRSSTLRHFQPAPNKKIVLPCCGLQEYKYNTLNEYGLPCSRSDTDISKKAKYVKHVCNSAGNPKGIRTVLDVFKLHHSLVIGRRLELQRQGFNNQISASPEILNLNTMYSSLTSLEAPYKAVQRPQTCIHMQCRRPPFSLGKEIDHNSIPMPKVHFLKDATASSYKITASKTFDASYSTSKPFSGNPKSRTWLHDVCLRSVLQKSQTHRLYPSSRHNPSQLWDPNKFRRISIDVWSSFHLHFNPNVTLFQIAYLSI